MYSYETMTEAVSGLEKRGYTVDFNVDQEIIVSGEFEIAEYYRFEGDSDPADEAIVYAIESAKGVKGILVNGYGISSESAANVLAEKLKIHHI